jgi:hypothetical protein
MEHFEEGETLRGYKIYAEARKISGPEVISKSERHRAQRIHDKYPLCPLLLHPCA